MSKYKKMLFVSILLVLVIIILVFLPTLNGDKNKASFQNESRQENIKKGDETGNDLKIEKKKPYLIGYSQCNFSEPWRAVMNDQMKAAALKHPEFELIIKDGMQDNNKQTSDIESLIQKKCDLIFVSPNEAKPLTDIIENVYKSGIPIILLDRKIDGESYTQYIGADNFDIGKKAGEWAADYLGDKGGNVVEISGSLGTSAQIERHEGFLNGIKGNPEVKIIDSRSSDWLREKSIAVMEKMLNDHKKIDVVFAQNDPSAEGAYTAAKNANREKEIKFIDIDALPTPSGGIKGVIDGRISVTYLYPQGAQEAIESAYKLLVKKETLVKNLRLDTLEITKSNAVEILKKLEKNSN